MVFTYTLGSSNWRLTDPYGVGDCEQPVNYRTSPSITVRRMEKRIRAAGFKELLQATYPAEPALSPSPCHAQLHRATHH